MKILTPSIFLIAVTCFVVTLIPNGSKAATIFATQPSTNSIARIAPDGSMVLMQTSYHGPQGLAVDPSGNLFAAYSQDNTLIKFSPANSPSVFGFVSSPFGVAADLGGNVYVSSFFGNSITKYTPTGIRTVFANSGLSQPVGLAVDSIGNVYATNYGVYTGGILGTIVKITPNGETSVFKSGLRNPDGIAIDSFDNIFVAEQRTSGDVILKIAPTGESSVFVGEGLGSVLGLAFDKSNGDLYASNSGPNNILKFSPNGDRSVFATTPSSPGYIAVRQDPIPEPGTFAFGVIGLGTLTILGYQRRRD